MSAPDALVSGLVVVDKPAGYTSHDVVGRMRGIASTRKVGHSGTLDPMATGVLVLGINRATRLLGYLTLVDKEYLATIRLGQTTVTDDAEGDLLIEVPAPAVERSAIEAAVLPLTGEIAQVPSAVSAIKVDGVRSYARVRAGEEVALRSRAVTVSTFEITGVRSGAGDHGTNTDVDVRVVCSSGTYVRALARDLGAALGVGGHLTMLRRTRVGGFGLDLAHTLEDLEQELSIVDLDTAARESFNTYALTAEQATDVRFGRVLTAIDLGSPGPVALFDPLGAFLALYEQRGRTARAVSVFV